MQQLSWKNFPAKIEKSLCKLYSPKYIQNPVHNSVTIYRGKAFSSLWCVKGSFTAPAARRLARPLAPATVGAFSSPGRAIIKSRQSRPEGGLPCGPDKRWAAAGGDGKSGPVMRPLSWCGVGYSAATTGASGAFLRTLSMPLRQLALAL